MQQIARQPLGAEVCDVARVHAADGYVCIADHCVCSRGLQSACKLFVGGGNERRPRKDMHILPSRGFERFTKQRPGGKTFPFQKLDAPVRTRGSALCLRECLARAYDLHVGKGLVANAFEGGGKACTRAQENGSKKRLLRCRQPHHL